MLSRRVLTLMVWDLVIVGCGCSAVPEPDRTEPRPFEGHGFRATVRLDVLSNVDTPVPGVTLYDFHVGSRPLLFVYVGDKAGYPHFGWDADREERLVLPSGLRAHCRYRRSGRERARECLIALSESSPKQLMLFYEKLPKKWSRVADGIIESIAPRAL